MMLLLDLREALRLNAKPALAFAALGVCWGSFAALAPALKAQVGASDLEFGLVLLGTAIGLVPTMWLAPNFDASLRERALPVGAIMLGLAFALPGHVHSLISLFLVMCLAGLCAGLLDVTVNARTSDLEAYYGRTLMNSGHGSFSLGYAVAALLTGFARSAGFSPAEILTTAGLICLATAPFIKIGSHSEQAPSSEGGSVPMLPVLLCGGIVMVVFTAEAAVEAWSALHIERTLGGVAAQGAMGPALLGFTMTLGRYFGQVITSRYTERLIIEVAGLIAITGTLIAAFASAPWIAYVGFALLGLGVSVIGPLGIGLAGRIAPTDQRTRAIAQVAVVGFLGFFLAPALVGAISQSVGLRAAFASIAGLLALIPVLTLALSFRHRF